MKPRLIALGLALAGATLVLCNQRHVGVVRDEGVYMYYGAQYQSWWGGLLTGQSGILGKESITRTFGGPNATDGNREHPPLMKTLFGWSRRVFHDRLGLTGVITASRIPSALLFGGLLAVLCLWVTRAWGLREGILAALFMLLQPRAVFHAGLATFDSAITVLWFATLYCYWRSLTSNRWGVMLGLCFGCALATKHNAWLLPAVLGPHFLYWSFKTRRFRPQVPLAMAVIGPLVLFASWPWLWFDTFAHLRDWIVFHTKHVHYNYEYLGTNYYEPPFPWHIVFVTTLFVLPVVTLFAAGFAAGVNARAAWKNKAIDIEAGAPLFLMMLSLAVSMGVFLLPGTPIFGAEKHFMTAFPTIAVLAALGLCAAARRAAAAWQRGSEQTWLLGLAAPVVFAAAVETFDAQPYTLTHYNALAGGAPGGADLGMNRQFWGYAARGVLDYLNTLAPPPGEAPRPVYSQDAQPAWGYYREDGLLSRSLPDAGRWDRGVRNSQIGIVIHERHFLRDDVSIWREYGTLQPSYVLTTDGVPIVSVYVRPR